MNENMHEDTIKAMNKSTNIYDNMLYHYVRITTETHHEECEYVGTVIGYNKKHIILQWDYDVNTFVKIKDIVCIERLPEY